MPNASETIKIGFVVPCFNEESCINEFYTRVKLFSDKHSYWDYCFLFVNDGSTDDTQHILNNLSETDNRVQVIHLACNRGHQIAVTAGLDFIDADIVIIIDADLQDPPEVSFELITKIIEGFDIVHAQRAVRKGERIFKLLTAKLFYKFMKIYVDKNIVENCGDFRAINKKALCAIRNFREPHRFLRGMFSHLGFKQCSVLYDRDPRYAGKSKYTWLKMFRLAIDAVFSFSATPIKLIFFMSNLCWLLSLTYSFHSLYMKIVKNVTVPGWTSIIIFITFFSGLILFSISTTGAYVAKIFEQGKNRPLYWIDYANNISIEDNNICR